MLASDPNTEQMLNADWSLARFITSRSQCQLYLFSIWQSQKHNLSLKQQLGDSHWTAGWVRCIPEPATTGQRKILFRNKKLKVILNNKADINSKYDLLFLMRSFPYGTHTTNHRMIFNIYLGIFLKRPVISQVQWKHLEEKTEFLLLIIYTYKENKICRVKQKHFAVHNHPVKLKSKYHLGLSSLPEHLIHFQP